MLFLIQCWKLNLQSISHSGEWLSKCNCSDKFSFAQRTHQSQRNTFLFIVFQPWTANSPFRLKFCGTRLLVFPRRLMRITAFFPLFCFFLAFYLPFSHSTVREFGGDISHFGKRNLRERHHHSKFDRSYRVNNLMAKHVREWPLKISTRVP